MKINNTFKLIISIVVCELTGVVGAVFTTPNISTWYAGLVKPAFNPPAWVFGPVWALLYFLMSIAAFLIWKRGVSRKDVKIALGIFIGQLVLNAAWTITFFGSHNPFAAFIEIIFLGLSICAAIIVFSKISIPAAWLLVPYIIWVSFAGYLNYSIWNLNSRTVRQVACTMEAKLCPDGSYVGRTGLNCEFALCPVANTQNWEIFSDIRKGIKFQYPKQLPFKYIYTIDWPPQIQILNNPFSCAEAGTETDRAGGTIKEPINGQTYCVTKETQGAAGSIYTMYAYAFPFEQNKTAIFTFSLRFSQCANYEDPNKAECETERASFDTNLVISQIASTLIVK